MKTYKEEITLNRNNRGCYILDTVKGCPGASLHGGSGCYGDCYAKNIAGRYGFDFKNPILRKFSNDCKQIYLFGLKDEEHKNKIVKEIRAAKMPFIRIGEMGDPSYDWGHTLGICSEIEEAGKPIVIITKHWKEIPREYLHDVVRLGLCINTSISALDSDEQIDYRLNQFQRLKGVCHSVLRIVSCDFNRENADGFDRAIIQEELFKAGGMDCIDTVFRPSKNNVFVTKGIIKTKKVKFLRAGVLASVYNKTPYLGGCQNCPDMCGVTLCP